MVARTRYSSASARNRLRLLQYILRHYRTETDALLFIPGIDGNFNSGSQKVVKFLLEGSSAQEMLYDTNISDDLLEDIILVVSPNGAKLYCSPEVYDKRSSGSDTFRQSLADLTSCWPGLQVWTYPADHFSDADQIEEFKIRSFIEMIKDFGVVGIPSSTGHNENDPETWPLIQGYGLEGMGTRGLFSMQHRITDISSPLNEVLSFVDSRALESCLCRDMPLFERHWETIMKSLDALDVEGRLAVTESQLAEPLLSYFNHAMIREDAASTVLSSHASDLVPRLLFGVRTGLASATPSDTTTIETAGLNGGHALHAVVESVQRYGPLYCARTLFFSDGGLAPRESAEEGVVDDSDQAADGADLEGEAVVTPLDTYDAADARLLMSAYGALVEALLWAIATIDWPSRPDVSSVHLLLVDWLEARLRELGVDIDVRNGFDVRIGHRNLVGKPTCLSKESVSATDLSSLTFVRLELRDVPSSIIKGSSLGSLVVGDTFAWTITTDSPHLAFSNFVLSHQVPYHLSWSASPAESLSSGPARRALASLPTSHAPQPHCRKFIQALDECMLLFGHPGLPAFVGTCHACQAGFFFSSPGQPPFLLSFSKHLKAASIYDPPQPHRSLIIFHCVPDFLPYGGLRSLHGRKQTVVALAISPVAPWRRTFFREVLPEWRKHISLQAISIDSLSQWPESFRPTLPSLSESQEGVSEVLSHQAENFLAARLLTDAVMTVPTIRFDCGLEEVPWWPLAIQPSERIPITIVTGMPGSGKGNVSSAIAQAASDVTWFHIQSKLWDSIRFDAGSLYKDLNSALALLSDAESPSQVRVMLVTNGYVDVVRVIRSIYTHPQLSQQFYVASVTCVMSAINLQRPNHLLLPSLLDQCIEGFVQHIVLTHCEFAKEAVVEGLFRLVRAVNPTASVQKTSTVGGKVMPPADTESLCWLRDFENPRQERLQNLSCPGWRLPSYRDLPLDSELTSVYCAIRPVLDVEIVKDVLRRISNWSALPTSYPSAGIQESRTASPSSSMEVWRVKAFLRTKDPANTLGLDWVGKTLLRMSKSSSSETVVVTKHGQQPASQFFFVGRGLDYDSIQQELLVAIPVPPQPTPLRERSSLSTEEIESIRQRHLLDPLPEGYVYTGTNYASFDGSSSAFHPDMDKFIAEYLEQENAEIQRHNTELRKEYANTDKELRHPAIPPSDIRFLPQSLSASSLMPAISETSSES